MLHSACNWLSIRAVDGLKIPYMLAIVRYFETTVCIAAVMVENRAILVVHNSEQKHHGLLGMNVLSHVPELARCLETATVAENFRFAHVAGRQFMFLPGRLHSYKQWEGEWERPRSSSRSPPDVDLCSPLTLPCAITHSRWQLLTQPRMITG